MPTLESHAHALQVHTMQLHLHELLIAHVAHWDAVEPHALGSTTKAVR